MGFFQCAVCGAMLYSAASLRIEDPPCRQRCPMLGPNAGDGDGSRSTARQHHSQPDRTFANSLARQCTGVMAAMMLVSPGLPCGQAGG